MPYSFSELSDQIKFYLKNPKSLSHHLKQLTLLWSASILLVGMNFLATLLIVAKASPEVYAMYSIGLSILMLATNWTDAGLASTLTVLATQSGKERERLERYKQIGIRYAGKIIPIGFFLVLGLTVFMFFQSQVFRTQESFFTLATFAVIGVVSARTSFWNALLYASGNFKKSSVVQVAPSIVRIILIALAIAFIGLDLKVLLLVTLLPLILGWGLARLAWHRTITVMPSSHIQESQAETDEQIRRFLKPTCAATVSNSLSYNFTLLGASFFTAGIPIAGYGVFQRVNQLITLVTGPLNAYVGRQLRIVADVAKRKRLAIAYLGIGVAIYLVYAMVAFTGYKLLGSFFKHYSLNYPFEFLIFLLSNLLGYFSVMLDSVLAASGIASHRFLGTIMYACLSLILILILRPDNLFTMVVIDTISLLPIVGYYLYQFAKK